MAASTVRGLRLVLRNQYALTHTLARSSGQSRRSSSRSKPEDLLASLTSKFKDPTSPFYLPPGTPGPSSPEDHSHVRVPATSASSIADKHTAAREAGLAYAVQQEYDPESQTEVIVHWGEQDMFQHVNNVHFGRYFETARYNVLQNTKSHLHPQTYKDLTTGRNTGIVVKQITIKYIRPVTYPDTLLVWSKPCDINQERGSFGLKQVMWSLEQEGVVATCESIQVMYDFSALKKGKMTDEMLTCLTKMS